MCPPGLRLELGYHLALQFCHTLLRSVSVTSANLYIFKSSLTNSDSAQVVRSRTRPYSVYSDSRACTVPCKHLNRHLKYYIVLVHI